jgi:hypothetical protein
MTMGVAGGFMQLHHGTAVPPKRVQRGDIIAHYSPVATFGSIENLRASMAIGRVALGKTHQGDNSRGFKPHKRDGTWSASEFVPIERLPNDLEFTRCQKTCGYQPRFGFFPISKSAMQVIVRAMKTSLAA